MSSASSASVASAAAVRRMKPSPSLPARAASRARNCSRSSGTPIFCETPMWGSCGRYTSMRPAMLTCVESRAPLLPIGSLTTWTTSVWPSESSRSMGCGGATWAGRLLPLPLASALPVLPFPLPLPLPCCAPGTWTSATCRNAARSSPMSTNADCIPGSTRTTLPV
jgi:hypothetical protein